MCRARRWLSALSLGEPPSWAGRPHSLEWDIDGQLASRPGPLTSVASIAVLAV